MNKGRLKLIAVMAVFVLPIIFAFVLQPLKEDLVDGDSLSHGKLVTPQVELKDLASLSKLRGKWTLLAFAGKHCDASCLDNMYRIQQIRLTQGEGSKRVARMLISEGKLPVKDLENLNPYIGTQFIRLDAKQYEKLVTLMQKNIENEITDNIYLIDPLGYYMMTFDNGLVPKGIIRDLKHLLRNSRVG